MCSARSRCSRPPRSPRTCPRGARPGSTRWTLSGRSNRLTIEARVEATEHTMQTLTRDVRHALRALGRTPAFTITVVATLALAIGANGAVFSALDAVLFKPLPFPNGDRLTRLTQSVGDAPPGGTAPIRVEDWNRL